MTFKELIELYKSDKASDMQKKMVEDEVEKFEAVSDYVYSDREDGQLTISAEAADPDYEESTSFAKSVRKQIRHSFLRMGAYIIIIVIVIIAAQAFLPSIVNKFYYEPAKEITVVDKEMKDGGRETQTEQQITLDYAIYSQLHMPLEYRDYAIAYPLGYGKYNVSITQTMFRGDEYVEPAVGGQIVRDNLTLIPPDFLDRSVMRDAFTYNGDTSSFRVLEDGTEVEIPLDEEYANQNKGFLSDMKKLDKDQCVKAIISFKEPISFEKMIAIENKYELGAPWYAVKTAEEEPEVTNFGFSSYNNKGYEFYDNDKYPNLFVFNEGHEQDEKYMRQFFLSMISYMNDQKEFLKTFDPMFEYNHNCYQEAYDFVKENGLNIYGTVAYVDYDTAKKLVDDGIAYEIQFKNFGRQ